MKNSVKFLFTLMLIAGSVLAFAQKSFTKEGVNIPAGRNILMQPDLNRLGHAHGKITIDLVINKKGDVISAHANAARTTIMDRAFVKKVEETVMAMKFNKMMDAPAEQRGSLSYSFM